MSKKTGIGPHLRTLRIKRRMKQQTVADAIGLKRETLSRIENGHHDPRMSTLTRYCDAIGARIYIGLIDAAEGD